MAAIHFPNAARRSLYICQNCRRNIVAANLSSSHVLPRHQLRSITKVHIDKIKTAEREWRERAGDVSAGRVPSMLSRLEERGYINQIVGYGSFTFVNSEHRA